MDEKNKSSDFLTKTLTAQLIICVVIFILLFAFSKLSMEGFREIKNDYSKIIEENITKDEAVKTFKKIEDALSAGVKSVIEENEKTYAEANPENNINES